MEQKQISTREKKERIGVEVRPKLCFTWRFFFCLKLDMIAIIIQYATNRILWAGWKGNKVSNGSKHIVLLEFHMKPKQTQLVAKPTEAAKWTVVFATIHTARRTRSGNQMGYWKCNEMHLKTSNLLLPLCLFVVRLTTCAKKVERNACFLLTQHTNICSSTYYMYTFTFTYTR